MATRVTLQFDKDHDLDADYDRELTVWVDEAHEDESVEALNQLLKMANAGVEVPTGGDEKGEEPSDPYEKHLGSSGTDEGSSRSGDSPSYDDFGM